jgi:hypothetical protein
MYHVTKHLNSAYSVNHSNSQYDFCVSINIIPKGASRIRISKKNRQHNGQKKKYKRINNDQQNITHKTKDQAINRTYKNKPINLDSDAICHCIYSLILLAQMRSSKY